MTEVLREKIGCDVLEKDDEVMEAEDSDRDRMVKRKENPERRSWKFFG